MRDSKLNNSLGSALSLAVIGCLSLGISSSTAASINYGDFAGTNLKYVNVQESSGTDPVPLFGAPNIIGDALDFDPQAFTAYSSGGGAPDLTDGQLNFGIQAKPGKGISGLLFSEAGDYSLVGAGTANTSVSVSSAYFVDILEVDGVPINPIQVTANMLFAANSSGDFDLQNDSGTGVIWTGSLSIDLATTLTSKGVSYNYGATRVNVVMDNTLVAQSEANTTAFIAKKDYKGVSVTVVPEPSSIALLLVGALLVAPRMRKH